MKKFVLLVLSIFLFLPIWGQSLEQAKPWMGIAIESKPNGVGVKDAIQGTPAERAGLKSGDLIKKIDSTTIKDSEQLISYIQSKGVGMEVTVEFERDKKLQKLSLKLEAKPDDLALVKQKLIGKPVPDFSLEGMNDKKTFTKKDVENKVTILEFWATWCGPCRASHERLSKFAEENPSIQVLAISNEDSKLIQKYISSTKHKFTTVRDSNSELFKYFLVSAIPMSVVLDKQSKIQSISLGGGFYLEESLKTALELSKK